MCHICSSIVPASPLVQRRLTSIGFLSTTHWVAGIDRCYVVEKKKDEPGPQYRVQTDGINFEGAFVNYDLVDVNAVTCNDVSAVLRTFGVEAARKTVVAEVGGVFSAYGIGVDSRHLSLISDHMTRQVKLTSVCHVGFAKSPACAHMLPPVPRPRMTRQIALACHMLCPLQNMLTNIAGRLPGHEPSGH